MDKKSILKKVGIYVLFLSIVISFITFLRFHNVDLLVDLTSKYGYLISYGFAFCASLFFFLLIPIPSFAPIFVDSGLSYVPVVFSFILGELTASIILVILALLFREKFLERNRGYVNFYKKLQNKFPRIPYVIAFFLFLFTPNEITLVVMVLLHFKLRYLIPILLVANTFYNFAISHLSSSSVEFLTSLLGV